MFERRGPLSARGGAGLRVLTGNVTSPSLMAQLAGLRKQFPDMRWHQWEPLHRDNERSAAAQSFGRPLDRVFDLDAADIVFAVESDLISAVPGWLAYARAVCGPPAPRRNRWQDEPRLRDREHADPDRRQGRPPPAAASRQRSSLRCAISPRLLGAGPQEWKQPSLKDAAWLDAAAEDLVQHHGRVLVHAGREQPAEMHLLADAINGALGAFGATIRLVEPIAAPPPRKPNR